MLFSIVLLIVALAVLLLAIVLTRTSKESLAYLALVAGLLAVLLLLWSMIPHK